MNGYRCALCTRVGERLSLPGRPKVPLLGAAGAALFGFVRLIQPPRVRDSAASRSACTRSRSSSAELTAERDCSWQCHSFCSCAYSSEMHTCAYSVQYSLGNL